ncbi:MAG: neutral zinc metallopeptidase [Nocardioidaceae bacterium]
MRYNPRARLDRSQVSNRRGGGGGLGGGGGRPSLGGTGVRVGGGLGGLLLLVLVVLVQSQLGGPDPGAGAGSGGGSGSGAGGTALTQCSSGAQANQDQDCAILADVNSIQSYWEQALPTQAGVDYTPAQTDLFSGRVQTGCGVAASDVGPFYCPADRNVYLDTTFFTDMLQGRLGARGGAFARSYVLAHEYGHHVQDLLGTMDRVRSRQGSGSDAVRLELQADCLAGVWTRHATTATDADGLPLIVDLSQDDVDRALDAAAAVGDDRIQRRAGGQVSPETWTHGSAEQRKRWFSTGRQRGTLAACDTFAVDRL